VTAYINSNADDDDADDQDNSSSERTLHPATGKPLGWLNRKMDELCSDTLELCYPDFKGSIR
jgi:hypothetical protein